MVKKFLLILLTLSGSVWGGASLDPQTRAPFNRRYDFLENKSKELDAKSSQHLNVKREESRRGRRRFKRDINRSESVNAITPKNGNVFDVGKVTNYKVLRDDQVVEIRNPRTGKLVITVMKASALPEEELNRFDLEYTLMELDELSIQVEKHDESPRTARVGWDGKIYYPLVGELEAKGKTIPQLERSLVSKFKDYIHSPVAHINITQKSPLARILVIGSGFKEFQGHEKILDILGSGYEPSVENIYDKVCVIRKLPDGSFRCIVVDMEFMFKRYDFRQNIPLKAGDIIHVKKMPPLFGYRFKFWWQQILTWLNEVDELFNAVKSIHEFELED